MKRDGLGEMAELPRFCLPLPMGRHVREKGKMKVTGTPVRWLIRVLPLLALFAAGAGCAFNQPVNRSRAESTLMRFDDRSIDADVMEPWNIGVSGSGGCPG